MHDLSVTHSVDIYTFYVHVCIHVLFYVCIPAAPMHEPEVNRVIGRNLIGSHTITMINDQGTNEQYM